MPVLFEIRSADDKLLMVPPPAEPPEVRYVKNYFLGELSSLICGQCLIGDIGGTIHLVQDPELILMVNQGADVTEVLSEQTATVGLIPEEEPVKIPFTTKKGAIGSFAMRFAFPDEPFSYN